MEQISQSHKEELDRIIEELARIRRFQGPPREFWPEFLRGCANMTGARLGILLVRQDQSDEWRRLSVWPSGGLRAFRDASYNVTIDEVAEAAAMEGYAFEGNRPGGISLSGILLELEEGGRVGVAVFIVEKGKGPGAEETAVRLKLLADIPTVYQFGRMTQQARSDVIQFAEALDLMVLLNAEKKYVAAAMTFCNEISSRYRCQRVSLGWLKGGYIRIQAISHMEKFEKKMDAIQYLEAAMEEAFDQDEEILWPQPEGSRSVVRDHEAFARGQGAEYIASLPVRLDGESVGGILCERGKEPFSEDEIKGLRVFCDQAARRLDDLKRHDRWFGARMTTSLREQLSKFFGLEHTFAKCMGVFLCLALAFLIFGKWNYRVEAPFILKTDDLSYLPAPFEGYIDKVLVQVGDRVDQGEPLMALDTDELLLEESSAIANLSRYSREAEKARAQNALAEMKIALAIADQSKAQLEMVRYHLSNAVVKAPFSGIVVEGELKEMLGAPIRKGDILFKVALIEEMYAELDLDERDIHEVADGATGEIAFVSQPKLKYPIRVQRIDPVAFSKEEGNVFVVRGVFTEDVADWWRPGMSGVAKINVGKRNLLWIFTHRTVDFFRLLLWW